MTLAVRLPPEIDQRLQSLAKRSGRSKASYAREAIIRYLEDLEDEQLALERLETPTGAGRSTSWSAGLTWSVEWDERARRELRRLDPAVQRQILGYLRQRIVGPADPA